MEFAQFLSRGFEYDLWANRRWLDSLGGFKNPGRAFEVVQHILGAQLIWLERCGGDPASRREDLALEELFSITSQIWKELVKSRDLGEVIEYKNTKGEDHAEPIAEIALHVINHGTYHRGQLRGLAEADGFVNFPETDFLLFLREVWA